MLLYLIRHGQSESNLVDYDLPDGNLTPLGVRQAEEVAGRLVGESIDRIFSSPYRRALQTAGALHRRIGAAPVVWPALSEFRPEPVHRFMSLAEVRTLVPAAGARGELPADGHLHGLETPEAVGRRAADVLAALRADYGNTHLRVAVFAHWAFISTCLGVLTGAEARHELLFEQANCCVSRVRLEPHRSRILSVNETGHLTELSF